MGGRVLFAALALAFVSLAGLIGLGVMQVTSGRRAARQARRRLSASPRHDDVPAVGARGLVEGVLRIEDGQAHLTCADGTRLKVRVVDESRAYVGHQRCGGLEDGAQVRLIGATLREPGPSASYRTDAGDAEVAIDVLEVLTPGMTPRSRGA